MTTACARITTKWDHKRYGKGMKRKITFLIHLLTKEKKRNHQRKPSKRAKERKKCVCCGCLFQWNWIWNNESNNMNWWKMNKSFYSSTIFFYFRGNDILLFLSFPVRNCWHLLGNYFKKSKCLRVLTVYEKSLRQPFPTRPSFCIIQFKQIFSACAWNSYQLNFLLICHRHCRIFKYLFDYNWFIQVFFFFNFKWPNFSAQYLWSPLHRIQ